jgi:hypothetical protein
MSATIIAFADARLPDRRKRLPLLRDVERHRDKIATIGNSSPVAKMDKAIFAAIDAHCAAAAAYHAADSDDEADRTMVQYDELTLGLLRCRVVTAPGILALLDHLAAPAFLIFDRKEETGETILSRAIQVDDAAAKEFPRLLAVMLRNSVGMFRTREAQPDDRP